MDIGEPDNLKTWAHIVDGKVVNVSVWDGVTPYNPAGLLVDLTGVTPEPGIGWDYDGKKFVDNRPVDSFPETV